MDAWINDPSSTNKASTRDFKLSGLRSFFDFLIYQGWSTRNPTRMVSVKFNLLTHAQKVVKDKEVFTEDEFALVAASFEGFFRDAAIISYEVGLRLGDICNLEFVCFNLPLKMVTVVTDKADTRVDIPITRRVVGMVKRLRIQESGPYLFPKWREIQNDPKRRGTIPTMFKRKFVALGFEDRSFHCLRKTYATNSYRAAMRGQLNQEALNLVSKNLGHGSTTPTKTYISIQ